MKKNFENPSIVIGHDCRFAGELFLEAAVKVYLSQGIKVKFAKGFVSTPMVSLGAVQLGCSLGVVLTASHNPGGPTEDFGIKFNSANGGPAPESLTNLIFEKSKQISRYNTLTNPSLPEIDLNEIKDSFF